MAGSWLKTATKMASHSASGTTAFLALRAEIFECLTVYRRLAGSEIEDCTEILTWNRLQGRSNRKVVGMLELPRVIETKGVSD